MGIRTASEQGASTRSRALRLVQAKAQLIRALSFWQIITLTISRLRFVEIIDIVDVFSGSLSSNEFP